MLRLLKEESMRVTGIDWSRREDSNPLPEAYKATALPDELRRHWHGQSDLNRRLLFEGQESLSTRRWPHGKGPRTRTWIGGFKGRCLSFRRVPSIGLTVETESHDSPLAILRPQSKNLVREGQRLDCCGQMLRRYSAWQYSAPF